MGTKIQSNRYVSGYCSIWSLNESVNNDVLSLYQDGKAPRNGQHYDPVLPQKLRIGGNLEYDKETVRQMILEHESTFRHQVIYIYIGCILLDFDCEVSKCHIGVLTIF